MKTFEKAQGEQRRFTSAELRATSDYRVGGIAASYNTQSANLGGFVEKIAPGAFAKSLAANVEVKALMNHDPNLILGRTKNGTLTLSDSPEGLRWECQLDKTNPQHQSFYSSIKRGDIDECSFAFRVPDGGDDWDTSPTAAKDDDGNYCCLRTLRNVELLDVSAVTYPAYQKGTAVGARSKPDYVANSDAQRRARVAAIDKAIAAEDAAGDEKRRAKAAEIGKLITRTHMDSTDVSSAREAMALDEALKQYGYRLVSCTDSHAYGVPADYDGDGSEDEDCTRWAYEMNEGKVTLDHANRETYHGWVKSADKNARARYFAILPERRQHFADSDLKRRMQSSAGIFVR
jgi:HK97 family phage prohead protease